MVLTSDSPWLAGAPSSAANVGPDEDNSDIDTAARIDRFDMATLLFGLPSRS
jgi:hypothetical protein